MGSFNTTCSVSKLPIGIGDEVKIFFLIKNPYTDNLRCYINDEWNLFGIPLDAVYDDYGTYELIENEQNLKIWDAYAREFKNHILEVEQGPNQYHDCPVSRDNITFTTIQNAIWEGRAQLVHKFLDHDPINLQIDIMAIHKTIYDSVSESFKSWRGEINLDEKLQQVKNHEHYQYYLNYKDFLENYNENELELDNDGEMTEEAKKIFKIHLSLEWTMDGIYSTPPIYEDYGLHLNSNESIYNLMYYTLDEYAIFAKELIQMYLFKCNMVKLNISHSPMLTSGQDYHFMDHIAFHEKIIDVAKKLHETHDSWDD